MPVGELVWWLDLSHSFHWVKHSGKLIFQRAFIYCLTLRQTWNAPLQKKMHCILVLHCLYVTNGPASLKVIKWQITFRQALNRALHFCYNKVKLCGSFLHLELNFLPFCCLWCNSSLHWHSGPGCYTVTRSCLKTFPPLETDCCYCYKPSLWHRADTKLFVFFPCSSPFLCFPGCFQSIDV